MPQNHVRWSPQSCSCVIDLMIDSQTGDQTLFCIRNLCDIHRQMATPDPDFVTKKTALLTKRYQDLDDNKTANYAQIDYYTDLQMSPSDKIGCRAIVDRLTSERKQEYDLLLSQPDSNLYLCVNVHDTVREESIRWPKVAERVRSQYNLTPEQIASITWSFSGTAPNRTLTVNFGSLLTTNQKNTVQTWCNTNIGSGRVIIL